MLIIVTKLMIWQNRNNAGHIYCTVIWTDQICRQLLISSCEYQTAVWYKHWL